MGQYLGLDACVTPDLMWLVDCALSGSMLNAQCQVSPLFDHTIVDGNIGKRLLNNVGR